MRSLNVALFFLASNLNATLHDAIVYVESGNNARAVGDDGRAYGILQITKPVVIDVNNHYGTHYKHEDAFDPPKARDIFDKYLGIYATEQRLGRPVTDEDRARIWNGGPHGWKESSTLSYWRKVRRYYGD